MRCVFERIAAVFEAKSAKYRYRCIHCGIKTGWTPSPQHKVVCECTKSVVPMLEIPCIHRGPIIGSHACELCGQRGVTVDVYQCELLGKPCTLRQWENSGKARKAGEVSCLTCGERES